MGGYVLNSAVPAIMGSSAASNGGEGGEKRIVLGPVALVNNNIVGQKVAGGEEGKKEGAGGKVKGGNVKKPSWPKTAWEECYDTKGKPVWIHTVTKQLVHNDPYE